MTAGVVPMQERFDPARAAASTALSGRYVYLGPFQIDQERQEITKNGEKLKVQGKVYQVLMTLLEKPGQIVTREELRQRLWPAETHVNFDANVNTTVNKLRLALGDSSDKPVYIETIPRKGYSLLVQPEVSATARALDPVVVAQTEERALEVSRNGDAVAGHRLTHTSRAPTHDSAARRDHHVAFGLAIELVDCEPKCFATPINQLPSERFSATCDTSHIQAPTCSRIDYGAHQFQCRRR